MLKLQYLFLLFIGLLFFTACPDDDDIIVDDLSKLDIDLVTGIQLRDENGQPIGAHGNLNTYPGLVDFYPNPAIDAASILYYGTENLKIKQFWIFPGETSTDFIDYPYGDLLDNDSYSTDEASDQNAVLTDVVNGSSFNLDLSTVAAGYYRLFYLLEDGRLFWDNIYIDPGSNDLGVLQNQVIGDW